jgi:PAS domain S-box-containing protein
LSRDSVVAYVGAVAVGLIAFSPLLGTTVDRGPAGFLAILPLLWAALRCTQRETATVALVLSAFAVWGTMAGGGPFERLGLNESFLLLTMFMISTAAPSHALSADVAVRRAAEATLRRQELDLLRARGELERRVEQRTAALAGTNRALQTEIERRKRVEVDLHRDVAERKRTQQALTESERRFRLLMDGVTDYAIFMLDLEGRVANWNTGAERIKGYAAGEIIGRHFSCFYTEADRSEARPARALEAAARNGKCESEGWRVRKDGSRFWANVVVHAIRDESGCLIGFAKVTRDMTERREAQAALDRTREEFWQAQKMEALGHLTGGMAHDFNNFLTAVIGNIELVRATGLGEADDRRLESALQAARHGATLIRQMLVFARKQPLEVRCVDVNVVVEEIVPLIRRSCPENVQITTRTPKSPLPVTADSNLLQTSILNLALNARDAMPDGGTLTISIAGYNARGQGDPMPSRPDVRHIPDRVAIEVSDTGVGMSREILERVFEPFFTTKEIGKGTGLGLSMVYGATREMGGDIVIESEPGRGTTARIILPASVGEVPEVDERETDHAGIDASAAAPISLLCVEDDPLVGAATAEILENAGFRIVTVSDGEKALSVLRDRPDIPLVVTDIGLPGIGGHDLISRIRKDRPDLLALFISGHDWCCDAVPESRTDYVPKPYDSRELLRRVQALLSRNRVDCAVCDTAV